MILVAVYLTTYSNLGLKIASDADVEVDCESALDAAVLSIKKLSSLFGTDTTISINSSDAVCSSVRIVRL